MGNKLSSRLNRPRTGEKPSIGSTRKYQENLDALQSQCVQSQIDTNVAGPSNAYSSSSMNSLPDEAQSTSKPRRRKASDSPPDIRHTRKVQKTTDTPQRECTGVPSEDDASIAGPSTTYNVGNVEGSLTCVGHVGGDFYCKNTTVILPREENQTISAEDVAAIQDHLIKLYEGATRCVQVMPLEEEGLPLSKIYGSVLIEQDLSALKKTRRHDELCGRKQLDSVKDVFYAQDDLAKRVILNGEAGSGKTVFCYKLIDSWSAAERFHRNANEKQNSRPVDTICLKTETERKEGGGSNRGSESGKSNVSLQEQLQLLSIKDKKEDRELQSCLSLFDLVFYVPLRHANHGISSIADLVCDSVSECNETTKQKIRKILGDCNIKCLIILDGLDEYKVPDTCRVPGYPDSGGLVKCSVLCTMRPWRMVSLRLSLDGRCDKAVQILGLRPESIKTVISNVLVHFYGLDINTSLYNQKYKHFCAKVKLPELKSLMKIPLMLTASCVVWNEESEVCIERQSWQSVSSFITLFYLKLMVIKITRAENKHDIVRSFLCEKRRKRSMSSAIPSILSEFTPIIDFLEILQLIGRLALQDLMSDEPYLVFPKNTLEREIGENNVEIALKTGVLSQTKAPGLSYQQRVSFSFYHKSVQEFLAALYITCGDKEAIASFSSQCKSVDKVMELSTMIKFVFGLDPTVGYKLSKHVNDVANCDVGMKQDREERFFGNMNRYKRKTYSKVIELYYTQCKWLAEMNSNMSYTHGKLGERPTLHVSDICIYGEDNAYDNDKLTVARDLMNMESNSVLSMYLERLETAVSIIRYLPLCKHIDSLHISEIRHTENIDLLEAVLPQLVHLQHVDLQCMEFSLSHRDFLDGTALVGTVLQLPKLKSLKLCEIRLTHDVLLTRPTSLRSLVLYRVKPERFILPSICKCSQLEYLKLWCMDLTASVTLSGFPLLEAVELIDVKSAHFILSSIYQLGRLKYLQLFCITLKDELQLPMTLCDSELNDIDLGGTLLVTKKMTQLQEVKLRRLKMSARRWTAFISSLLSVKRTVHVTLYDTNIDHETVKTIHSSPQFKVTREEYNEIEFQTVQ